jgi:hypothetical protein
MTRLIGHMPEIPTPSQCEVAPHRYTRDGENSADTYARTLKEWRQSVPYQPGDVVYVEQYDGPPKLALIVRIDVEYDRWDERREKFAILYATKSDTWSRLFTYTYPGMIQRGYAAAGLAPDVVQFWEQSEGESQ